MFDKKHQLNQQLDETITTGKGPKAARMALSFIGGMIPIAGGVFSGISELWETKEREQFQKVTAAWLKLQEEEIVEIAQTLHEVIEQLDLEDKTVNERLYSPEYLGIVKKCFREWSAAESEKKRVYIRNLLINSVKTDITGDDIIRLFIDWIDKYSETHFKVLTEIHRHSETGISRKQIWLNLNNRQQREDSAEADLFKLIIHDLTVGRVIRQYRETDAQGNYLKQKQTITQNPTLTSAFDDQKVYVLTELGRQFVGYIKCI